MRISVIGAAGRLGSTVCAEGNRRRHSVTGLARNPGWRSPAVDRMVHGDARDPEAVRNAVAGADAVIVVLSGGDRTDPHRLRDATRTVIPLMTEAAAPRIIMSSAYPLVARRPVVPMALLRRVFAVPYADAAAAEQSIRSSELAWTIVRLNRLVDAGPLGRPVVATGQLDRATGIDRSDAATLLIDLAEKGEWSRTAINVRGRDARDAGSR